MISLPEPLPEWERLPVLERLMKLRDGYSSTLRVLKSGAWLKEEEKKLGPGELSWGILNADYYRAFPFLHPRMKWFKAQWDVMFNSFLGQIGNRK